MEKRSKNSLKEKEEAENMLGDEKSSKNGEFIESYFEWVTPNEQKKIANKLNKITKK